MKNLIIAALLLIPVCLKAQVTFHDASQFPLLGKISDQTETRYERLPASLHNVTRDAVWSLGKNTAGLAIRFRSNTTRIEVKWELLNNAFMNHMAMTGIKGLDLYGLEEGKWVYVNTARPTDVENTAILISDMEPKDREYMLYLPLYDGVKSVEIGVDSLASIGNPAVDLPVREKPVVCYGTSILQGGCASRPGMAHTSILSRRLNREFINLGFSGNGKLDYEIAEMMSGCDASVFVLDFMPNVNTDEVYEKAEKFYDILRSKSPDTPVVFIENPMFPPSRFNLAMRKLLEDKNKALHEVFDRLRKKGEKNIRLISSAPMIGFDNEATVDGIHFTDLGFMRYAEYLYPTLKKMIRN